MNLLTGLIFILGLGSINCLDGWVDASPEIIDECEDRENVGAKDIRDMEDMNVKCYYHCLYEKQGIIVNGEYRGDEPACKDVKDANKCELAKQVVQCSLPKN